MVARQIRVPEQLWEAAKAVADSNDETVSDVIRRELENYVRSHQ